MSHPLVSIGVPTFNRPDELSRVLFYLSEQTYSNIEIVVVDNCSTNPRVREVIRQATLKYKNIKTIFNDQNIGVLRNAEKALRSSTGEYFCWVSDDDWRSPDFIEKLVSSLSVEQAASFSFCDYREVINQNQPAIGYPVSHKHLFKAFSHKNSYIRSLAYYFQDQKLGKCNLFYALYKREDLLRLNFLKISDEYKNLSMDAFVVMSLIQTHSLVMRPEVLCTLTCSNVKHYLELNAHSVGLFRSGLNYLSFEWRNHLSSIRVAELQFLKSILWTLFIPKLFLGISTRIFRSVFRGKSKYAESVDALAVDRIMNANSQPLIQSIAKKIPLKNVTLLALATKEVEKTVMALKYSQLEIDFGAVKLVSHYKPWNLGEQIVHEYVQPFKSVDDWCRYVVYDLHQHVDTDYVMLIHADGFVVNPDMWRDDFLLYDYIGAPWPLPKDSISYRDSFGNLCRVGNSVSLRSLRLLKKPGELNLPWLPFHGFYNEDGFICVKHKKVLEDSGLVFANIDVAKYFSHEVMIPEVQGIKPFAFHKWAGSNKSYPRFSFY